MEIEAAEKWIVDLIRGSKLDAKIDSRDNNVIMGGTFPSVYQQVHISYKEIYFIFVRNLEKYYPQPKHSQVFANSRETRA